MKRHRGRCERQRQRTKEQTQIWLSPVARGTRSAIKYPLGDNHPDSVFCCCAGQGIRLTPMLKQRQRIHQELFKSLKEKQEREQDAYLPPGLINHGNTCFMNSVLQGVCPVPAENIILSASTFILSIQLVASRALYDLVHFVSNDQPFQTQTSGPILAKRSPQLTNGHGLGASADHNPVDSMPLGDAFIRFLLHAWSIQDDRKRETATPRSVPRISLAEHG